MPGIILVTSSGVLMRVIVKEIQGCISFSVCCPAEESSLVLLRYADMYCGHCTALVIPRREGKSQCSEPVTPSFEI